MGKERHRVAITMLSGSHVSSNVTAQRGSPPQLITLFHASVLSYLFFLTFLREVFLLKNPNLSLNCGTESNSDPSPGSQTLGQGTVPTAARRGCCPKCRDSLPSTLFFLLVGAGGLISFCKIRRHMRVMFSTTTGVLMFTAMRNRLRARVRKEAVSWWGGTSHPLQ